MPTDRHAKPLAVVALGGHALLGDEPATRERERASAVRAADAVREIARTHRVIVTHGNGPQVGRIERADPTLPLDIAVAETQGELGYLLEQAIERETHLRAVTLVTRSLVSRRDEAFRHPTKPIGPRATGRLVASPVPIEIVESDAIRELTDLGFVVIAAGGGGIPVLAQRWRTGAEAVIDKDLASARLAIDVEADALFLLTDVDGVHLDRGTPTDRKIDELAPSLARAHLLAGQFPPGSMGPKVEAALLFLGSRRHGFARIAPLEHPWQGTLLRNDE